MPTKTITSETAADKLRSAEAAHREAWEQELRGSALEALRNSLPDLDGRVKERRADLAKLRKCLRGLEGMRKEFAMELRAQPTDTSKLSGQEADEILTRGHDLRAAIDALDGAPAVGTLIDHLRERPRIAGTRRRIEEATERLAVAERAVDDARRQIGGS